MSQLILPRAIKRAYTRDGLMTFDAQTIDSSGVFLIGELERLDQNLHMPLASVTWSRDIELREDVSIADELSSFTNSTFAAAGGASPNGKSWIGKDTNAIAGIALDIGKIATPLNLWGMQLKYQMDVDEQVYIGDTALGLTGLVNGATVTNVSNAVTGGWATATPAQILADVNEILNSAWAATGYAICPRELRLDPVRFSLLVSQIVSSAGNISLLEFLKVNSLSNSINGVPLNIQPLKWLVGRGASGTNRMMAYTNDVDRVRFPLVPLQRTPLEYRDIRQLTTYFGRLGGVEFVYPETIAYRDGL